MGKMIGLGNELGAIIQHDQEKVYQVALGNSLVTLEKPLYDLWIGARSASFPLEEYQALSPYSFDELKEHYTTLSELGLVMEWDGGASPAILDSYVLIPKGESAGSNEDGDYLLRDYPKSKPIAMPLMPFFIWRYANPLFSLGITAREISRKTDIPYQDVVHNLMVWVPFLIANGLLSIEPIHMEEY